MRNGNNTPLPDTCNAVSYSQKLTRFTWTYTCLPVVDALRGKDRESQYEAKYKGRSLTEEQLGFHKVASLPSDRVPYLIENVVDTGTTARELLKPLAVVLSYLVL